jgi:hypothetical protein
MARTLGRLPSTPVSLSSTVDSSDCDTFLMQSWAPPGSSQYRPVPFLEKQRTQNWAPTSQAGSNMSFSFPLLLLVVLGIKFRALYMASALTLWQPWSLQHRFNALPPHTASCCSPSAQTILSLSVRWLLIHILTPAFQGSPMPGSGSCPWPSSVHWAQWSRWPLYWPHWPNTCLDALPALLASTFLVAGSGTYSPGTQEFNKGLQNQWETQNSFISQNQWETQNSFILC